MGEAGREVAQHVPVGVDPHGLARGQYLHARTAQLMIQCAHVDDHPKVPTARAL